MKLKDKVAIVTGGARGIGREIALSLAREGADVIICDVDPESLSSTRREIESLGVKSQDYRVDVTVLGQVDDMVNKILDKFGRVDILINNAGITRDNLLVRMKEEEWDEVISVNLKGIFNCTRAVSKIMLKQRYGRIINISSIIGIMGNAGQANYAASKAAIIGFTKSVAKELASRGITANAIAPGYIETEMTKRLPEDVQSAMRERIPLNRFGQPKDVANLALFLASEEDGYITGQVIQVDGGMLM